MTAIAKKQKKSSGVIQGRGEKVFEAVMYVLVTLVALTMIFPLLNIIALSFSSERAVVSNEVGIWPVEFTTNTYVQVVKTTPIFLAIKNTVVLTVVGTAISMFCTICTAPQRSNAISRILKRLPRRSMNFSMYP